MRDIDGESGSFTSRVGATHGRHCFAHWRLGVRKADGRRVSIPVFKWIDLRIQQRGPYDELRRADDSIAYRDVRIASVQMLNAWPAPEAVKDAVPEEPKANVTVARCCYAPG